MTLSRFFKNYLYISLGGNRKGAIRSMLNLMITMLLGGLWHGASWTFVIWGGIHGTCLIINHGFQNIRRLLGHDLSKTSIFGQTVSWALTFTIIIITWVVFRAESVNGAQNMIHAMLGLNGLFLSELILLWIIHTFIFNYSIFNSHYKLLIKQFEILLKLTEYTSDQMAKLEKNAYKCYQKYFEREKLFNEAENIFTNLIKNNNS